MYLSKWKGLRTIPQCWKALQSVLCASFFPRCDNESSKVMLPTLEMCRLTRGPCRLIEKHYGWPEFLRCENKSLFPDKCQNGYTDLKFNNLANVNRCMWPLVSTDDKRIWYPDFDGCSLQCHNPVFTEEQHSQVGKFIAIGAVVSIASSLFTILTFVIDKKSFKRYPAVIIFYLNFCILFSTFGWIIQFFKGRNEIVCRPDNTIRYGEPSKPDNFYCTFSFVLIYYFSFAALIWFVVLSYVYDYIYKNTDSNRGALQSKNAYFHMSAWSIPLILTVCILLIAEIDGDSLRGICFVGFIRPMPRIMFVFVPLTGGVTIGLYYMTKSVSLLVKVKQINDQTNTVNSRKKSKKVQWMIFRIALFSFFIFLSLLISAGSYLYELRVLPFYDKTLAEYIVCNLNISNTLNPQPQDSGSYYSEPACAPHEPPPVFPLYLQLIAIFGVCVVCSSWVWTTNTVASWKRFLNRNFHKKAYVNRPVRLKPYETIAKSYGRREQITQGTYAPSFGSNHNDLVDMDLNSAISQSLSQNFRENFNVLLERRCALSGGDVFFNNRNDSILNAVVRSVSQNLSISETSQQQLSVDSHSLSAEQIELAAIVRNQRRKTKKERERYRQIHSRLLLRRDSDTSAGSLISAYTPLHKLTKDTSLSKVYPKTNTTVETKSTSTADLACLFAAQPRVAFEFNPMAAASITPLLPPAMMMPRAVATGPIVAKPGVRSPVMKPHFSSAFTFTHGMSDQSCKLINPLLEIRRPDSQIGNTGSNLRVINGNTTPSNGMANGNYAINTLSANQSMPVPANLMPSFGLLNQFVNPAYPAYPMMAINGHSLNVCNPTFQLKPQPNGNYYNTYAALLAQQQQQSPQELQALQQERAALQHLITPMRSDSELSDYFPIQISDSEGFSSDARESIRGKNGYLANLRLNKQLVEERIKHVTSQSEQKSAP